MTFVPPVLHVPTPESRRAALTFLWDHGVRWGRSSISLDHDIKMLYGKSGTSMCLYWLTRFKCLDVSRVPPIDTTLVNSPAHLLSYLRRHGQLTNP